ncbi:phosphoadenylyl-sulfate reductase [Dyella jiangningensis]|uniref:Phosphoadenosine 5'-phosphosulfate reductase n=1 Tax=Dyella jiangningensis TaxID=1379159 RepID=A0A328P0Z1_9GAMM|nr:phosphoadenylyl-sulfate reductase [Dyella jiangningensis]RAO75033.1 phosphoadenosine phosphosulfate reductase [Dyella jiangningensis]
MKQSLLEEAQHDPKALDALNQWLGTLDAERRVVWALAYAPGAHVLSSSFGAQAAVSLHLLTRQRPGLPVVLIDTGYLFPETYQFIDALRSRLDLNLKVYSAAESPAWMEAREGRLWEQGVSGIDRYNQLRKVEPMRRALEDLQAGSWFAGLRRSQARTRATIPFAERRDGRWKFHPIADWTDRDVGMYLRRHGLPYHPLWDQGYLSIGDVHTTHRWEPGSDLDSTRFFGLKRECGLHGLA